MLCQIINQKSPFFVRLSGGFGVGVNECFCISVLNIKMRHFVSGYGEISRVVMCCWGVNVLCDVCNIIL